jgi:hypothetical protein
MENQLSDTNRSSKQIEGFLAGGPLNFNDVERYRMDAILSRFHSEDAINNAEQIDGFFCC